MLSASLSSEGFDALRRLDEQGELQEAMKRDPKETKETEAFDGWQKHFEIEKKRKELHIYSICKGINYIYNLYSIHLI